MNTPADYLYTFSFAIATTGENPEVTYLIPKDTNFLQEAYPVTTSTGTPKYYAQLSEDKLRVAPTPSSDLSIIHTYAAYPDSITKNNTGANTTWIGDNMDSVLLNGSLVEAAIFMKAEPDVLAMYKEQFITGLKMIKNMADGKLRGDTYRNGQLKTDVI